MLMKRLVNLVQLAVVIVILYPVYYVWDTDRIDSFCEQVEKGMSVTEMRHVADKTHVTLSGPDDAAIAQGQWMTSVESTAALNRYACVVIGAAETVANAEIVETENDNL
jgi:hypothetical protein